MTIDDGVGKTGGGGTKYTSIMIYGLFSVNHGSQAILKTKS